MARAKNTFYTFKFRTPYVVLADSCNVRKNCVDNLCNHYGGCIKGCIDSTNRKSTCDCLDGYFLNIINTCT